MKNTKTSPYQNPNSHTHFTITHPTMPRNSLTASLLLHLLLLLTASSAQLSPSDVRTLLRLRLILENPPAFDTLTRFTNPCYLSPSPSLHITCLGNRVTELSILGSPNHRPLSPNFSIDSLFTTLTRLQGLRSLSLVSLGIWGPLPPKVDRFSSLISLNLSSNYISGEIPHQISQLRSLQNLILAKNSINGSVPNLEAMSNLVEVDLGHNRLGPGFPSLPNTVISVSLKNNSIRSRVPSKVDGFDELRSLDVSYNRLVGPVPPFLFSLKSIEYLVLSNNRLSGTFLKNLSCNEELEFVDVSSNLLYGGLPMCIGSNSTGRVVLDSGNCLSSGDQRYQNPMKECQEEALAAVMMPKEVNKKESKNRLGLVLGVVGGSVVAFGVVLCLIFWWVKKKRNVQAGWLQGSGGAKVSMRVTQKIPADARHMSQAMRLGSMGLTSYRSFSLEEVEDATNNFDASNLIGAGFKGQLHKGWLPDGTTVVVRRLKLKQRESYQRLAQYMEVISKLRHRHLVSILGHCFVKSQIVPNTTDTIYVIFECVSNGTLRDHLTEWRLKEMMKWPQRVAAVIGIARGIQFLHSVMVPGIYRNGLRTENVLLDETLTAKVGSYNLPLPSLINNNGGSERHDAAVNDKFGRAENGDKGDIYHLGLILLEVITGKPVASHGDLETLKVKMQQSLADGHAKLRTVTDTTIRGTFVYDSLRTAVEIALNCVSENVDKRPSIEDVLWNLQYSVQLQEGWASSENLSTFSAHS